MHHSIWELSPRIDAWFKAEPEHVSPNDYLSGSVSRGKLKASFDCVNRANGTRYDLEIFCEHTNYPICINLSCFNYGWVTITSIAASFIFAPSALFTFWGGCVTLVLELLAGYSGYRILFSWKTNYYNPKLLVVFDSFTMFRNWNAYIDFYGSGLVS